MVSKLSGLFPDDCQFSGLFQNCPDFPDFCQFSRGYQNCPDFPRWLPIFRVISKLSWFSYMTANIPDDFKTVPIFQMTENYPNHFGVRGGGRGGLGDSGNARKKTFFSVDVFGVFHGMFGPFLTLFNTQTPFLLFSPVRWNLLTFRYGDGGGGCTQNSAKINCSKNRYFWSQKNLFHIFKPFLVHFTAFLVHFNLIQYTNTVFNPVGWNLLTFR